MHRAIACSLLAVLLSVAGCTTLLGIDEDYRARDAGEADAAGGSGGSGGGGGQAGAIVQPSCSDGQLVRRAKTTNAVAIPPTVPPAFA
jgi:hypothetical protein